MQAQQSLGSNALAPPRILRVNEPAKNAVYRNNTISNTKYTPWTFLPLSLRDQFRQFMNKYFLLIAILQLFPRITPVNPITTWLPLILIFSISATKEALDDLRRKRQDAEANQRRYLVVREDASEPNSRYLTEVESWQIRVGDIVRVEEDEEIPVDLVFLSCEEEEVKILQDAENAHIDMQLQPGIPASTLEVLKKKRETKSAAGSSGGAKTKGVCFIQTANLGVFTAGIVK